LDTPTQRKSDTTRERILQTAAELFGEHGYDRASLREIARKADMKAASIYYYFETKDDILQAVFSRSVTSLYDDVSAALQTLPKSCTSRQKIETAIQAHLNCMANRDEFSATFSIYLHLPQSVRHLETPMRERYFQLWLSLIEEGIAKGELRSELDPALVRRFILVGITRSFEWEEINDLNNGELADFFSKMIFDGLV